MTWWSDGDQVDYRERQGLGNTWTVDQQLSAPGEVTGRPDVADPGDGARVAFPIDLGSSWEIVVETRIGPPDAAPSFVREFLAISQASNDPEVRVEAQDGHLWVTWRHDDDELAWARLDGSGWTGPTLLSIPSGEDLEAARFHAKREVMRAP